MVDKSNKLYFDLQEGIFVKLQPHHNAFLEPVLTAQFYAVFGINFDTLENLTINAKQRKSHLHVFLDYYNLHLSNFDNLKTLGVLEEVLN